MRGQSLVWWDGQLVEESAALVPAISQGVLWGRGVFETIAVRQRQPFALTRHLARLDAGAARLGLQPPAGTALREAIAAVCADCPPELHRLRITLTGQEKAGLSLAPEPGHLLVRLLPAPPSPGAATLLTVPWRRNEFSPLSGVKATSYAENAVALAWAQDRSATEALFLNTGGDLCEGAISNLFLVRQGTLLTPSLSSGCLPGITRSLIIDLCPQLGVPCLEKALTPADLAAASEVFLTNSLQGILPVEACDDRTLPAPGPLTSRLTEALLDLRSRLPDP
jgi:branched-chain amino acid aminotransferase